MSPYFLCYDCSSVNRCEPETNICPSCMSSRGRIISDQDFTQQHDSGAIKTIDPHTKKPFKKKHKS
jgi:hypothetical protein